MSFNGQSEQSSAVAFVASEPSASKLTATAGEEPSVGQLPRMSDMDSLTESLDLIDQTLAELDHPQGK